MTSPPPNPHYRAVYRIELPEGPIEIETPNALGPESVAEFEEFLGIMLRGMKRRAEKFGETDGKT